MDISRGVSAHLVCTRETVFATFVSFCNVGFCLKFASFFVLALSRKAQLISNRVLALSRKAQLSSNRRKVLKAIIHYTCHRKNSSPCHQEKAPNERMLALETGGSSASAQAPALIQNAIGSLLDALIQKAIGSLLESTAESTPANHLLSSKGPKWASTVPPAVSLVDPLSASMALPSLTPGGEGCGFGPGS